MIGWDTVPAADRPTAATLIHLAFDAMVGLGMLLLLAGVWAGFVWWRRRNLPRHRLFWWLAALGGFFAVAAMEAGWVVTEVGRQPWVVNGLLRTSDAATTNGGVLTILTLIIVVYAVVGVATLLILRMLSRHWRSSDGAESEVPYGPSPAENNHAPEAL